MRKTIGFLTMTACLFAATERKGSKRGCPTVDGSFTVFSEILNAGDKGIPQDLVDKAQCAVIVPGLKKRSFHRRRAIRQRIYHLPRQE